MMFFLLFLSLGMPAAVLLRWIFMWVYIYICIYLCVCMVLTYNSSLYGCFWLWCYVYLLHMRVCVCAYGLAMVVLSGHVLGCVGSISFSSFGTVVRAFLERRSMKQGLFDEAMHLSSSFLPCQLQLD